MFGFTDQLTSLAIQLNLDLRKIVNLNIQYTKLLRTPVKTIRLSACTVTSSN